MSELNNIALRILEKDANDKQYRKILVGDPSLNNKNTNDYIYRLIMQNKSIH